MLDGAGLDRLFRDGRTHYHWLDRPVGDDELRTVFDLLKMGPTSANCSPARFLFLRTPEAKQRLRPALSVGDVDKTMAAPLFPHADARSWFAGNEELATATAFRNGTLQGAYLIMAARAAGLDCGPMSGFDNARVDADFLVAMGWRSNFLVGIGHGDPATLHLRSPRFEFDEACRLL